jgi:hypothetical protein
MLDQPINVVRFQNKVRGLMGLRGENPIPDLTRLLPAVVLENDRPEFGFAGLELLSGGENTQAAVAAQFTFVGVRNPADSGVLVTVTNYMLDSITGVFRVAVRVLPRRVDRSTLITVNGAVPGGCRDTRWEDTKPATAAGQCIAGVSQGAAISGFAIGGTRTSTSGQPVVNHEPILCVLGPGSDLLFWTAAINQEMRGSFQWYERALERGLPS